ncbi:MAG: Na/Pi cotransporter family protein, partial [Hyphomicrobiaceae bacterium]
MDTSGTELLIRIAGSAALLLWGARMARTGMTRAFGGSIRRVLTSSTKSRTQAVLVGLASAATLQSSTAVAMLVSSFAASGAIGVAGGLAVMLGADLGSALIAPILALNIQDLWPVMFFVGYVLHSHYEKRSVYGKQMGRVIMGLGCIFLSLGTLSSTAGIVGESDIVHRVFAALGNEPALAILIAALLTWVAHSSLAVLLLIAVLATAQVLGSGDLPYVLTLGVNAGAALPALAMGFSQSADSRRILVGNTIFRVAGVIVAVLTRDHWVPYLESWGYGAGSNVIGLHIAFNIALVLAFVATTGLLAWALKRFIPDFADGNGHVTPAYLDATAMDTPSIALSMAARETLRMADLVETMLRQAVDALKSDDIKLCSETHRMDDSVDNLYGAIKLYLTDLTRSELEKKESARAIDIISFTTNLENAGDIIDRSLLDTVQKKINSGQSFSDEGMAELMRADAYLRDTIHLAANVFMEQTVETARDLVAR